MKQDDSPPTELSAFVSLLDAQPAPVQDAFNYCLFLLMAQAGKMRLAEKVPSGKSAVCIFEMTASDRQLQRGEASHQ
jgi:hypothetical protein